MTSTTRGPDLGKLRGAVFEAKMMADVADFLVIDGFCARDGKGNFVVEVEAGERIVFSVGETLQRLQAIEVLVASIRDT